MSLEEELTAAFIEGYHMVGKEVGYWGRRFLQAVKRNGGLATAQRISFPETKASARALMRFLKPIGPSEQSKQ